MKKLERIILRSKPVSFIALKSKQTVLPGFYGVPLYDVVVFFMKQIKRDSLSNRASAISYNFFMAIPAMFICICTTIPYIPTKKFTSELLRLTNEVTRNREIYLYVQNFLHDFTETPRVGLLSASFLLFIFYASNAMMGVLTTFDKSIYQHEKRESFLRKRWKAIKMTVIMYGLIIGAILLIIGQGFLFSKIMKGLHVTGSTKDIINILNPIVTVGLFFYGYSYIYKYGTSVKKRWHTFSPGAVLATCLTVLSSYIFSFWVNNFSSFNKIYGSLGTLLVLMLLIYINSLILLIGFELNVSITYLKAEAEERQKEDLSGFAETELLSNLDNKKHI